VSYWNQRVVDLLSSRRRRPPARFRQSMCPNPSTGAGKLADWVSIERSPTGRRRRWWPVPVLATMIYMPGGYATFGPILTPRPRPPRTSGRYPVEARTGRHMLCVSVVEQCVRINAGQHACLVLTIVPYRFPPLIICLRGCRLRRHGACPRRDHQLNNRASIFHANCTYQRRR
jgi:hypothetical protein